MKRTLAIIISLFFCGNVFSQIYTPTTPTIYGQNFNRTKPFLASHLPEKDSLYINTGDSTAQIFYNKYDSSVYVLSREKGYFKLGESSGGGGVPVTRIWLDSLRRSESTDSIYEYFSSYAGLEGRRLAFLSPTSSGVEKYSISGNGVKIDSTSNTYTFSADTTGGIVVNIDRLNNSLALYLKLADISGLDSLDNSLWHTPGYYNARYAPFGSNIPAGNTTEVQFNNSGVFGASSNFTWTNGILKLMYPSSSNYIEISAAASGGSPYVRFFYSGSSSADLGISGTLVGNPFFFTRSLFVGGGHVLSNGLTITNNSTATPPTAGSISLFHNTASFINFSKQGAFFGGALGINITSGDLTYFTTPTNYNTFNGTEAFRIVRSTSNFLIGTATDDGNKLQISGNLSLKTIGNKIKIATGSNASIGTATLVAGTVTVNTTAVATGSKIFVTVDTPGGTQGFISVPDASIVNATSFVINSSSATETSTVNWWIIN